MAISSAPLGLHSPAMSLLVAFDVERGYIFRSPTDWTQPVRRGREEAEDPRVTTLDAWREIFQGHDEWDTRQLSTEEFFSKPLGWMATLTIDPESCPELSEALQSLDEKVRGEIPGVSNEAVLGIRAVVFPIGIGVLIIRIQLPDGVEDLASLVTDLPGIIKDERTSIIQEVSERYRERMEVAVSKRAGGGRPLVRRYEAVDRRRVEPAGSDYKVLFVDEAAYKKRTDQIAQITGTKNRDNSEQEVFYRGANIYVGWVEALARGLTSKSVEHIEDVFIIALASWYALIVMNFLVSLCTLDAFESMATTRTRFLAREKKRSHARRLAYMETANAAHPVRWTMREANLRLLEAIHKSWSSRQWWETVEERSNLLAVHYEQLEGEANERRNLGLVVFGTSIAGVTLGSAIADVIGLFPDKARYVGLHFASISSGLKEVFDNFGFVLAVLLPVMAGMLIAGILLWPLEYLTAFLASRKAASRSRVTSYRVSPGTRSTSR